MMYANARPAIMDLVPQAVTGSRNDSPHEGLARMRIKAQLTDCIPGEDIVLRYEGILNTSVQVRTFAVDAGPWALPALKNS